MGLERVVLAFENENTSRKVRALLEGAGLARGLICRTAAEVRLLLGQQQIPRWSAATSCPTPRRRSCFDLPAGRTMVLVAPENLLSLCGRSDGLVTLSTPALPQCSAGGSGAGAGPGPERPGWSVRPAGGGRNSSAGPRSGSWSSGGWTRAGPPPAPAEKHDLRTKAGGDRPAPPGAGGGTGAVWIRRELA